MASDLNKAPPPQLGNVIDYLTNNANLRPKMAAAILDIEKSFEQVLHNGFFYKLIKNKIPQKLTNTIQSY